MMKLFIILLMASFSSELLVHAHNTSITDIHSRREVPMKGKNDGCEEKRTQRSPVFYPVRAFIDGSDLQLEFQKSPCTIEVNIVNILTGEVCYTETDVAIDTKTISLSGLASGDYRLELSLNESILVLYGDFGF